MKIELSLVDIVEEFSLDKDQAFMVMENTVNALTVSIHERWISMAQKLLNTTRNEYIKGLIVVEEGRLKNSIILTGSLNNMVENGAGAFDMKNNFRNSNKVKYTKDGGWYLTIPYRFGVPTTLGESSAFVNIMPADIYDLIKKGGQISSSDLSQLDSKKGTKYGVPKTRKAVSNISTKQTFEEYKNKHSIYEGIKKNKNSRGNSYVSFRRVSEKSDDDAWIHTGIIGRDVLGRSLSSMDVDTVVENVIDNTLNKLGF